MRAIVDFGSFQVSQLCESVNELNEFLILNCVSRSVDQMREDLTHDACVYFMKGDN
jgi:hypothetical protein